jgi:serine protease Do
VSQQKTLVRAANVAIACAIAAALAGCAPGAKPSGVATPLAAPSSAAPSASPETAVDSAYTEVSNDSGSITVELPTRWSELDGAPFEDSYGAKFDALAAAADLDAFSSGWSEAGVDLRASATAHSSYTVDNLLNNASLEAEKVCVLQQTDDYAENGLTGKYAFYTECGDEGSEYAVIAATDAGGSVRIVLTGVFLTEEDRADWSHALATLQLQP